MKLKLQEKHKTKTLLKQTMSRQQQVKTFPTVKILKLHIPRVMVRCIAQQLLRLQVNQIVSADQ